MDIEDTPYTDTTIAIYQAMLERGFTNKHFGMAVQSYLYRAEADTKLLLANRTTIRLVKGAYKEPPDKAFPKKADVDANYDLLAKLMIDASLADGSKVSEDGRIPPIPAIATHDEKRIEFATSYAEKVGLPQRRAGIPDAVRDPPRPAGEVGEGWISVRVYVPFGTHWYPYFMRRLAERPANIWFFISNFFRG